MIASFYDNNGKVVWVADGYVDRALLPQSSEPSRLRFRIRWRGKFRTFMSW